jgi:predicted ATPase
MPLKQNSLLESIFIGRKKEITLLKTKLNNALANKGSCLFITGEAGMGKSRLIDEFLRQETGNAMVFRIDAKSHMPSAREFFIEIIRSYLQRISHNTRTITRVIDDQMYNEFANALPELSLYYPYEAKTREKAMNQSQMNALFYKFLAKITDLSPVVMILDDFHESGDDVRYLIDYFLQHIGNVPVLLILVAQENPVLFKWFDALEIPSVEKMILNNLQEEDLLDLNTTLFKSELDQGFIKWLSDKTKGVPLFLKEFLYAMFEKGIIYYDSEAARWRTISSYARIPIPDRVTEMIKARLQNLPRDSLQFLKNASVMGDDFDPSIPILQGKRSILVSLRRTGFITKENDQYAFAHPLIRETLYDQIPVQEKTTLHKKIGYFYLEHGYKRQAVEQLLAARDSSAKILKLLITLGQDTRQTGDYARSYFYLENALALVLRKKKFPAKRLVKIMLAFSKSLFLYEKYGQMVDLSENIVKSIKKHSLNIDDEEFIDHLNDLSQALIHLGKYQDALKTTNKALRMIKKGKSGKFNELELELVMNRAFLFKNMGKVDKALDQVLNMKNIHADTASAHDRYNIYRLLGAIYNEKQDFEPAITYREAALNAAQETGIDHIIAAALGNLGVSLANAGELKKGMGYLRQYQNYNIRAGRLRAELVSYIHIAQIYFNQGYFERADSEFKKGITRWKQSGTRLKEVQYELQYRYGTFLVVAEKYDQAHEYLINALNIAEESDNPTMPIYPLLNLGCLYLGSDDLRNFNKILKTINTDFKEKARESATFNILRGFQLYKKKNQKQGLKQITYGLQLLRSRNKRPGLFRLLYLCTIYLRIYKGNEEIVKQYMSEAKHIATELNMNGWLERFSPVSKESSIIPLKINCFGSLQVEHPVQGLISEEKWQRVKPKQLLSLLITTMLTNTRLNRARIGALLWPELSTEKMINNFHVCLHQLKEIIGNNYIQYTKGLYRLVHVWIDVQEFNKLHDDAEVSFHEGKIHLAELKLKDAMVLYQGDFLEDTYDPWIEEVRNKYSSLHRNRMLMLGRIYFNKMEFDRAVQIGKTILAIDPFDEEAHRFLMRAHLGSGEKAKAINQYKKCVELFKRELNCLPSDETQQVYRRLL